MYFNSSVVLSHEMLIVIYFNTFVESEDVKGIVERALRILSLSENESARLKAQAVEAVKVCDWSVVGRRHLEEVYKPLLNHAS